MAALKIKVAEQWIQHPTVLEWVAKGHQVSVIVSEDADLILHPNAWRWDDGKWDFAEVAFKEARKGQPKPAPAAKAGAKPRRGKGPKGAAK